MNEVLPQLGALRAPCDVRNDGVACGNTGAYSVVTYCTGCQQRPEHRLVCTSCLTTMTVHGVLCSGCREPLLLGEMVRLSA